MEDYYPSGKRWWFRLHEKGGKFHEVPAHHKAEDFMGAYLQAAGLAADSKGPLFPTVNRARELTRRPMHRNDAIRMIKRWGRGSTRARHLLSYIPGHRHHRLSGERGHH